MMLNKINEIISTINFISCNIKNIQQYVGTKDETDISTVTGRLSALERLVLHDSWVGHTEWYGVHEWGSTPLTQSTIKEW